MAERFRKASVIETKELIEEKNGSKHNNFSEISAESEGSRISALDNMDLTMHQSKTIVQQIIKGMFQTNMTKADKSETKISMSSCIEESLQMDKRLEVWYKTLRERELMQTKISRRTGKRPEEMLFNLPVSVEQHDKGTIQRLLDIAGRMNPERLSKKTPAVLPGYIDRDTCLSIPELHETLPEAEKKGQTVVEISGLPSTIRSEVLGVELPTKALRKEDPSKWVNSQALEQHVGKKFHDIRHVVEFYPDIEKLEVVGMQLSYVHNVDFDVIHKGEMVTISSTTSKTEDCLMEHEQTISDVDATIDPWRHVNVGVKINNKEFIFDQGTCCQNMEYNYYFECEPYQVQLQTVLLLENIGKRSLQCDWYRVDNGRSAIFWGVSPIANFLCGDNNIVLLPGDVYPVRVVFQPFFVCNQRQLWELRIHSHLFVCEHLCLTVLLHGKCVPSAMYTNKVRKLIDTAIDKSNDLVTRNLTNHHSELVPIIQPAEDSCPNKRVLNDLEIFNNENIGYGCDRFDDIECLRMFYNSLKMPQDPPWDMRLDSIKRLILRSSDPLQRQSEFDKFVLMKQSINYDSDKRSDSILDHSGERERSCLIFVRGCIANGIDEWEELVTTLEQRSLILEFQRFYTSLYTIYQNDNDEISIREAEPNAWFDPLKHGDPEKYVLKKLRSKKYYRDSIYIQTYSVICDIVENIVSVIESTDYI